VPPNGRLLSRSEAKKGEYAVAQWKNILFLVWCTRAERGNVKSARAFTEPLRREHAKFSVIHILEDTAGLPSTDGRDELVAVIRENTDRFACVGALLSESVVMASLLRAFVRGVRTLTRGELEVMIEHDVKLLVDALAPLHSKRSGVRVGPSELAEAIAEARKLPQL